MGGHPFHGITVKVGPLEQAQSATLEARIHLFSTKLCLNAVHAHELIIGSEADIVQAAVEASVVGLGRSNAVDAEFLDNHLINIVDQVDVRRTVFGIGQDDGAVAANEHSLDGAIQFILSAIVTGQLKFLGRLNITGQFRLGIVLEHVIGNHIVNSLEHRNLVGGLVGLDDDVASSLGNPFLPLAVDGYLGVFT